MPRVCPPGFADFVSGKEWRQRILVAMGDSAATDSGQRSKCGEFRRKGAATGVVLIKNPEPQTLFTGQTARENG